MSNHAHEGDDIPEPPLRAILFGSQFVALDDAEHMGFSASGPNCIQTSGTWRMVYWIRLCCGLGCVIGLPYAFLAASVTQMALRLLQSGFDPERQMIMFRANQKIGSTTIAAASQRES
jgi:hypothetical protein